MTAQISPAMKIAFLAILLCAGGADTIRIACAADETPEAFVHSIYDLYRGDSENTPGIAIDNAAQIRKYFEPSTAKLMIEDEAKAEKNGEAPDLDGDPFVDAQDWSISSFDITVHHEGADKASATVRFTNLGKKSEVRLSLIRLKEGWRIYDILWSGTEGSLRGLYRVN